MYGVGTVLANGGVHVLQVKDLVGELNLSPAYILEAVVGLGCASSQ